MACHYRTDHGPIVSKAFGLNDGYLQTIDYKQAQSFCLNTTTAHSTTHLANKI